MRIDAPRDFREDTRMPHFYHLSNNDTAALRGSGQEGFPDAEIRSITHYLFVESKAHLKGDDTSRKYLHDRLTELHGIVVALHFRVGIATARSGITSGTPRPVSARQLRDV